MSFTPRPYQIWTLPIKVCLVCKNRFMDEIAIPL